MLSASEGKPTDSHYQPTSMSITLTANYKETLPSEIVEIIDNLVEDGRDLEEVLSVYDYFGEEYAENLEAILEVLENTDASEVDLYDYIKSDLYDFIAEHGVKNLEYFEQYSELRDEHDHDAVDAYISLMGCVSCIDSFENNYRGQFDSHREFVEDIMNTGDYHVPGWIHIDYDSTWGCELRHEYDEEDGYYFTK